MPKNNATRGVEIIVSIEIREDDFDSHGRKMCKRQYMACMRRHGITLKEKATTVVSKRIKIIICIEIKGLYIYYSYWRFSFG